MNGSRLIAGCFRFIFGSRYAESIRSKFGVSAYSRINTVCVDLTNLNENVCRETYPLPKIDALLGEIGDCTVFTKIDANSDFWQEKLARNSQLLTTFLSSFGRSCFQPLPFGLKSAPERFQKRILNELEGLEGVIAELWRAKPA